VSVKDGGFALVSSTTIDAPGKNGVWCEGGSVTVVKSQIRAPGAHGVYAGKAPHPCAIEDSSIVGPGQAGIYADAEVCARRTRIEAPGQAGIVAHAEVTVRESQVEDSKGWGVVVHEKGRLSLVDSTVSGSQGANLDVKEATVEVRGSALTGGASSGVVLQQGANVTLLETKIEDNAQGSLYAIPGAHLRAADCSIRGPGPGLWVQGATASLYRATVEGSPAVDVRGATAVELVACKVAGPVVVREAGRVRLAACEIEGAPTVEDGATLEVIDKVDVQAEMRRALGGGGAEFEA
jgi:hypothetical protein